MNLYLIERVDDVDYDETSGIVVTAESEKDALLIMPPIEWLHYGTKEEAEAVKLSCKLIGTTHLKGGEIIIRDLYGE